MSEVPFLTGINLTTAPSYEGQKYELFVRSGDGTPIPLYSNIVPPRTEVKQPFIMPLQQTVYWTMPASRFHLDYCNPATHELMYRIIINDHLFNRQHFNGQQEMPEVAPDTNYISYMLNILMVPLVLPPIPADCYNGYINIWNEDGTKPFVMLGSGTAPQSELPIPIDGEGNPLTRYGGAPYIPDGAKYRIEIQNPQRVKRYEFEKDLSYNTPAITNKDKLPVFGYYQTNSQPRTDNPFNLRYLYILPSIPSTIWSLPSGRYVWYNNQWAASPNQPLVDGFDHALWVNENGMAIAQTRSPYATTFSDLTTIQLIRRNFYSDWVSTYVGNQQLTLFQDHNAYSKDKNLYRLYASEYIIDGKDPDGTPVYLDANNIVWYNIQRFDERPPDMLEIIGSVDALIKIGLYGVTDRRTYGFQLPFFMNDLASSFSVDVAYGDTVPPTPGVPTVYSDPVNRYPCGTITYFKPSDFGAPFLDIIAIMR